MTDPDVLVVPDVAAWRAWLDANEDSSDGVWLLLARKGVTDPTSLSYAQALDEALCSGWIDGQAKRIDEHTYRQRFTPRRQRSLWSARNVQNVARLSAEQRMRPRGFGEVERARADGRWERAYQGPASIEMPPDLARALDDSPAAAATYATLNGQNRYAVLHRVATAGTDATRQRRIAKLVGMLARGETPYPQ
ncbi:YdeI/OmpD-associated family protein [Polymorphospora rubra]|uniref:Bacteriocin-protection protein, YdeI/OmpD-associated family n=1 Tax=Polymorphospora rubra TaxID=338584 RepID=A0A810N181_9ACTN|nr:YdeI/OmpD-associated family protein [Polymorphospora rubra]BCJ65345.1 hypothetical protein Prubr_23660 [Polymorphospora rubra]